MKQDLRQELGKQKRLTEHHYFMAVSDNKMLETIANHGASVGMSKLNVLGDSKMGVYLSRHADTALAQLELTTLHHTRLDSLRQTKLITPD